MKIFLKINSVFKITFLILLNLFFTNFVFSQDVILDESELQGEWQNSKKFIHFDFENKKIVHELKTFYGLWRDKPFPTDFSSLKVSPLVFEKQLFMEYWILDSFFNDEKKSKLKLYLPASNVRKISLDNPEIQEEVYAYLFLSEDIAIKIRYWLVDLDFEFEDLEAQRGMITENTVDLISNTVLSDLQDEYFRNIKKYLKIGDKIYTCIEGRGTKIRNIEKINFKQQFEQCDFFVKRNKSYLVLEKAYMFQTID